MFAYLGLLRGPTIGVLWTSHTLSTFGDRLYAIAIIWLMWSHSGSGFLTGLVAVLESLPYIFMALGGRRYVARLASFRSLAQLDLARFTVLLGAFVGWSVGAEVETLLVSALLMGFLGACFDPLLGSLIPDLVDDQEVPEITSLMDLAGRLARIAGPALAGFLVLAVSVSWLLVVDAATFLVSAVTMKWVHTRTQASADTEPILVAPATVAEQRARRLLAHDGRLAVVVGLHGLGLMFMAVSAVGLPMLLTSSLDAGAGAYAMLSLAIGAGALAGNPLASRSRRWLRYPWSYMGSWAVQGAALCVMGLSTGLATVVVAAVFLGLAMPLSTVTLQTYLGQTYSGDARRALMTFDFGVTRAGGTIGLLVIPSLLALDPGRAFTIAGATLSVIAVAAAGVARVMPPQDARGDRLSADLPSRSTSGVSAGRHSSMRQ